MCWPSSGKLETNNIFFRSCFLQVMFDAQSVRCFKHIQIRTLHTSRWFRLHLFFGIILIDCVYS